MLRKLTPTSLIESPLGDVFDAALRGVPRMDRVRFITHHGKQILLIDETNCGAEEVIELLTEVQRVVTAQPPYFCLWLPLTTLWKIVCKTWSLRFSELARLAPS